MPTIFTGGNIPWFAGKSLGQIEAEKEAYTRGHEEEQLDLQRQQIDNARIERDLARTEREERDIIQQNQFQGNLNLRKSQTLQQANEYKSDLELQKEQLAQRAKESQMRNVLGTRQENRLSSKKPSLSKTFSFDRAKFERGEITKEDMLKKYPYSWYRKQIETSGNANFSKKPLDKQPIQNRRVWHLLANKKAGYASMNKATRSTAKKIRTNQDLVDLIKQRAILEQAGVHVKALIDYYKPELIDLYSRGLLR